ncbi:MAG: adenosylmethionine decarboxylase [Polyangiaceae bacterium]|nr:adenosylmethionine decarboxylase [Polyangiaceae bacterium]
MTSPFSHHQFGRIEQIIADFYECETPLSNAELLESFALLGAGAAGAKVVGQAQHEYVPHGVTLVVFLEESHILVSTWPEHHFAIVEVLLCNDTMNPEDVINVFVQSLRPKHITQHRVPHTAVAPMHGAP